MLHARIRALMLLGISALLCGTGFSETTKTDDVQAIKAALYRWQDAFNRGDHKTTLEIWATNDVVLSWPGRPDRTYRDIVASASKQDPNIQETSFVDIEEVLVSGDLAYVRDTWRHSITDKSSGKTTTLRLRSIEIWRKLPQQGWKITRSMLYDDAPARTAE
jgi:ketosteroid isomerase-like protein